MPPRAGGQRIPRFPANFFLDKGEPIE